MGAAVCVVAGGVTGWAISDKIVFGVPPAAVEVAKPGAELRWFTIAAIDSTSANPAPGKVASTHLRRCVLGGLVEGALKRLGGLGGRVAATGGMDPRALYVLAPSAARGEIADPAMACPSSRRAERCADEGAGFRTGGGGLIVPPAYRDGLEDGRGSGGGTCEGGRPADGSAEVGKTTGRAIFLSTSRRAAGGPLES